ncbi:MAG: hypothetical protein AABX01_07540 [Candidatus Micrarchaeota archaeon]
MDEIEERLHKLLRTQISSELDRMDKPSDANMLIHKDTGVREIHIPTKAWQKEEVRDLIQSVTRWWISSSRGRMLAIRKLPSKGAIKFFIHRNEHDLPEE